MGMTIDTWLDGLGLGQYSEPFRTHDIDLRALPHLTEEDLREMQISLGHRRIILAAIEAFAQTVTAQSVAGGQTHSPVRTDAETPQTSPAERRHLTVLFADLVGFTEMTNRFDPEEMRTLLQRYQDTVAGEVSRYGGYVAKYLGDGLLVFFGWPTAYEDHLYRAVKSALEAIKRVQQILGPDGRPLASRIGVASGPVVVGDFIGSNSFEEGAATGRVLNLAARIQAHADANTVVLPAETRQLIASAFEFSDLGPVELKGFDEVQPLVQVVAERDAESRFRTIYGDADREIVGRQTERDLLQQAWARARSGAGEAVVLVGEAGIGKSRLAEEFLAKDVDADAAHVIRWNCSPYFSNSPFHPVADRMSRDAGIGPGDDDTRIADRLSRALAERGVIDTKLLPVFAALVTPASDLARPVTSLAPQEQKDLTTQTLVEAIRAQAQIKPVLLVVEDAHCIDPSTQRVIERVIATCSDIPLLVLATHRPEWVNTWADMTAVVSTLQLRKLSQDHVSDLIAAILGQVPDKAMVDTVLARTDGVPLFVEEVVRAMQSSGDLAAAEVPSTLQGAMMARLDAVPPAAKQVALTASVLGREFEPAVLCAAMGMPRPQIAGHLEELRRAGLVFESGQAGDVYVFRHALIRDTAYQSMMTATRRDQHALVAQALLTVRPAEIERAPELVARHLTEADDHAAAFAHWRAAAEKALARSASEEAVSHAQELLNGSAHLGDDALEQRVIAHILVGRSYESIGRLPESLKALSWAAEAARDGLRDTLFAEAAYRFTEAALIAGERVELADTLCQQAIEHLSPDDERLRCRLLSQLARCAMHRGHFSDGARYSREAVALAERLGDLKAQFAVRMSRFFAPLKARDPQEVRDWKQQLAEMQAIADKLDDIDQGRDRSINFYICAEMGDRAGAEEALDRLDEVGQARNHLQLHWVERHGRAMMAILDGDFAAAEAFAQEALKVGRMTHGAHVEGVYGVQLFTIRREQARLHEVAPIIKRLMDDMPGDPAWKPGFAVIACELGYHDAARRILGEFDEAGFNLPMDAMYSTTLTYLSEVCIGTRDDRLAARIYDLLLPYRDITITAGVATVCNGAAARRLGGLAAMLGDWDTAREHFEAALQLDSRMRASPWIAHTKADYARGLRAQGRAADITLAERLETEALEIAAKSGMVALTSKLVGHLH